MTGLNLFYLEPDPDRWFPYDRYLRKIIRRIFRGKTKPGGVMMVALGLMQGLDKLGVPYRFNDFKYADSHPDELVCIIGKPHLLFERKWKNPILFGAGVFSHPNDCRDLFERYPNVKRILVPGDWILKMFEPWYSDKVQSWPVGIDAEKWAPSIKANLTIDFLVYDKVRWEHDLYQDSLINPILSKLKTEGFTYKVIQYGHYVPDDLVARLSECKAVIFLCEHETQGIAYQQILATGTPILAWDRGGYWQDPQYFPNIKYMPVSSVPYWDDRCGMKFKDAIEFENMLTPFINKLRSGIFDPSSFIKENLTLEISAKKYLDIVSEVEKTIDGDKLLRH